MGFIQNDDAVLAEEGICEDLPQEAPIRHVPDGSVLKGLIAHSAAIQLGFSFQSKHFYTHHTSAHNTR